LPEFFNILQLLTWGSRFKAARKWNLCNYFEQCWDRSAIGLFELKSRFH